MVARGKSINLFKNLEMPLVYVLADMELTGIRVNKDYLIEMGKEINKKIDSTAKEIYSLAGEEFNISSPKQLGDILFVKMGLPYPKRIKNESFSTSVDILQKIEHVHPIISLIEEYRTLTKLNAL